MVEIFTDKQLQNRVEDFTLHENISYFIKLKEYNSATIEKEVTSGQCARFLNWHPKNHVGQIVFRDVVGFVNLFNTTYNVKSIKLLADRSGTNQAEHLLKEISEYSSTLIFSPGASGSFHYEINPRKLTSNIFYIYKYLTNNLFHDGRDSLQHFFELILGNPHFNQRSIPAYVPAFSIKKFNHLTSQRITEKFTDSFLIPPGHELYEKPFIAKLPTTADGSRILPKNLYSSTNSITYDTPENRFLKYFLSWCQGIFLNIFNRYSQYQIREDCEKALKVIKKYLYHPFFQDIGTYSFLPTNSSVFANRSGYRELFLHYLKCRNQPKIFDDYLSTISGSMEIKNISTLYEYWVFFKIAKELFGKDAVLAVTGQIGESNKLKYGLKITKGSSVLYYNKTYKHSPTESYNFSLRPDISLETINAGKTRRYFFDAKYSNSSLPSCDDEPVAVYKNPNVVKMLSYLEAINDSDFAVIVYPGTKFTFYSKKFTMNDNVTDDPTAMTDFAGVGALPLSPNHIVSNQLFSSFMTQFKNRNEFFLK